MKRIYSNKPWCDESDNDYRNQDSLLGASRVGYNDDLNMPTKTLPNLSGLNLGGPTNTNINILQIPNDSKVGIQEDITVIGDQQPTNIVD